MEGLTVIIVDFHNVDVLWRLGKDKIEGYCIHRNCDNLDENSIVHYITSTVLQSCMIQDTFLFII